MGKFIRRHQKKILAVFTAGLMIVFIVDTGYKRYHADTYGDTRVVGQIGEQEFRLSDVRGAEQQLRFLLHDAVIETGSAEPGQQFIPVLQALLPPQVVDEWLRAPVTYLLLQNEAHRIPVYIDPAQVERVVDQLLIRLPDRVIPIREIPQQREYARAAIGRLQLVFGGFGRAVDTVKVSQPIVMHTALQGAQRMSVNYVDFDVNELLEQAPQPTEEQLRQHFQEYADVDPQDTPSNENPLGFGYRYPPRVRLQYIAVSRDLVKQSVRARKNDAAWEKDAYKYYLTRQHEFRTLPPSTAPADEPATQAVVRLFDEVRDEIIETIMTPEMERIAHEIRQNIETTMSADYKAWAQAQVAATQPGDGPPTQPAVSSLGVPYDSYEYLEQLAASIQKRHGVLPTIASLGELKSQQELSEVPEIGSFAREIFVLAEPFVPEADRENELVLSVYEPSPTRRDADRTSYIYRITAAETAHAPADLSEVAERVEADVKKAWAWQQARDRAERLLEQARSSELSSAAGDRQIRTAGPFSRTPLSEIPGLELEDFQSRNRFILEAYKLLADAAQSGTEKPLRIIELPREMKLLVAQLDAVQTALSEQELYAMQLQLPSRLRQQWIDNFIGHWFSYDAVTARMKYDDHDPPRRRTASLP